MKELSLEEAADRMRKAIGESKAWFIGWLVDGDDGVLEACRVYDEARKRSKS